MRNLKKTRNIRYTPEELECTFKIVCYLYRTGIKANRPVSTKTIIQELEKCRFIPVNSISISRANQLLRYFGYGRKERRNIIRLFRPKP